MRVLVCNLDPAWDFVSWTWRHGVDLYGDPGVTLWDASGKGRPSVLHWPDILPAATLAERLREDRNTPGEKPELVILLAGLAAPLDPASLGFLSDTLADAGKCILLSTARHWNPVADKGLPQDLFDAILLSKHHSIREHYYLFRLLLEVLRSEWQANIVTDRGAVLEAEIEWEGVEKQTDNVIQAWPGYITKLLGYYEDVLRIPEGVDNTAGFEAAVGEYLDEVTALLDRTPPETSDTDEDATLPSIDTPLFYQSGLLANIDRACRRFYDSLRGMLHAWYDRIKHEHDYQTELIQREGDELLSQLERRAVPLRQTLHRDAVRICKNTRKALADDRIPRARKCLDEELSVMQGVNMPRPSWLNPGKEKPSTQANFIMPWFQEDERMSSMRNSVRQSARALSGRNWFLFAPFPVAMLVALPVFTRVLADGPAIGWLDGAWVLMFLLPLLGSQIFYAVLRHRRLRSEVYALRNAARDVRARHLKAVQASYRYMYAREALRRLDRLDRLCRLYLEEMETDKSEVVRHQAFLKELAEYFRDAELAMSPVLERGKYCMDGRPRTWLAMMLGDYLQQAALTPRKFRIRISDVTGPNDVFTSCYLKGVDILDIRKVSAAP